MEVHACVCVFVDIGVICTCGGNRWQGEITGVYLRPCVFEPPDKRG